MGQNSMWKISPREEYELLIIMFLLSGSVFFVLDASRSHLGRICNVFSHFFQFFSTQGIYDSFPSRNLSVQILMTPTPRPLFLMSPESPGLSRVGLERRRKGPKRFRRSPENGRRTKKKSKKYDNNKKKIKKGKKEEARETGRGQGTARHPIARPQGGELWGIPGGKGADHPGIS